MPKIHVIVASTSGHTEYVIGELVSFLKEKAPTWTVTVERAEEAQPDDLLKGDVLLLACGTWNTGGSEGQLNPHMHMLLRERAKDVRLKKKPTAVIGLGDKRYRYAARAADLLEEFVSTHGGTLLLPVLKIVNEPYGQEEVVRKWGKELVRFLAS